MMIIIEVNIDVCMRNIAKKKDFSNSEAKLKEDACVKESGRH